MAPIMALESTLAKPGKKAPAIDLGLSETDRQAIAHGLEAVLADTFTLYLKTHGHHWNVTGPLFQTLHELFEEQYNALWMAVDDIAERIRALGFKSPVGYDDFSRLTSIKDHAGPNSDDAEMVRDLVVGHETLVRTVRKLLPAVESVHDEVTADLLIQRLAFSEKTAWMLRSMLQ